MKENSLGTVGNSRWSRRGMILQSIMGWNAAAASGSMDMTTILSNVAGRRRGRSNPDGVIGIIKNQIAKK